MITYIECNIFKSPAQVLTNTVNCVGVMGKGLALEFKTRYPAMFEDYKRRCDRGEVRPGRPYVWEDDSVQVLNFPTKRHWRDDSRLDDIEAGLKYLAANYQDLGISTLALPQLGCGNGGLQWSDVRPLIDKHLAGIPDLEVFVYVASIARTSGRESDATRKQDDRREDGMAAQGELPL